MADLDVLLRIDVLPSGDVRKGLSVRARFSWVICLFFEMLPNSIESLPNFEGLVLGCIEADLNIRSPLYRTDS